jgi:hypothetical protein
MSPVQITMLLHYYARCEEPERPNRHVINELLEAGLLEPQVPVGEATALWKTTEKGRFYVERLCTLPLPVMKWVMPESDER